MYCAMSKVNFCYCGRSGKTTGGDKFERREGWAMAREPICTGYGDTFWWEERENEDYKQVRGMPARCWELLGAVGGDKDDERLSERNGWEPFALLTPL
jgi:hypothetical protein